MPNRCDEIRKIVADCLSTHSLKEKIFNGRYTPVQNEKHFPSVSIITPTERIDSISSSGKLYKRITDLYIILFTRLHDKSEEERDVILKYIEAKINNLNHSDFDFEFDNFDTDISDKGVHHSLVTTIKYNCIYNTDESEINDYKEINNFSIEVTYG